MIEGIMILLIVHLSFAMWDEYGDTIIKAIGEGFLGIFAFIAAVLLAIAIEMQEFVTDAHTYFDKRKNEDG